MPDSRPQDLEGMADVVRAESGDARPSMEPPAALAAAGDAGAMAWFNNQKVNALWCINQSRNSWVSFAGVGWRKLANNSDSAIVALTVLAGSAKLTQAPVNYRQEADGMVYEIYAW